MPHISTNVDLEEQARWVWRETLAINRRAPETRIASSLSPVEIFVALYYGNVLNFNPAQPLDDERDRCIISKGHGSICMYPILADLGFFAREELQRVCCQGGFLGGIPDPVIPGYETVNGSLGHGLGVASGMAVGLKTKQKTQQVFVVTGDGELHEGACWEAIMFAAQHRLDNLNLIVDNNAISMLGYTDDIVSHRNLCEKLQSFGWDARVVDGHNVNLLREQLLELKATHQERPKALICNTIKGKGVPDLENKELSHILGVNPDVIDNLIESSYE
ncbi:transketolase [Vibrio ruber]|uniref:transketolase n=1 Tax=Vibrio ruber TaxID=184755 RepID=UPI0028932D1E|nr:transketolase [Vibrio ruber]WNJ96473.1 transketolase [Vibrio ruber]